MKILALLLFFCSELFATNLVVTVTVEKANDPSGPWELDWEIQFEEMPLTNQFYRVTTVITNGLLPSP